jgi:hypothetical protein
VDLAAPAPVVAHWPSAADLFAQLGGFAGDAEGAEGGGEQAV